MFDFPIHPDRASTFADEVDVLYFALWGLTILFTLIVAAMVFILAYRYRRGNKVNRKHPVHTHHGLELAWSIIPLILGLMIFAWGAKLYADVYKEPKNAKEVFVIGKQWMWHLQHSNGIRENNELHCAVGQPVKLTMISQDVIHSFFVPAFRIKRDVLPGKNYNTVWFTPTRPGKYHLFCAEYCGTSHSEMGGYVYVMQPSDFQRWLDSGGAKPGDATMNPAPVKQTMAEQGAELYQQVGCANCHVAQDTKRAPSLYSIYGKKRQLDNGQVVVADRGYLREAILKPNDRLTAGYPPLMPTYEGQLKEEQVNMLIEYIRSLGTSEEPKSTDAAITSENGKPTPAVTPNSSNSKSNSPAGNISANAGKPQNSAPAGKTQGARP